MTSLQVRRDRGDMVNTYKLMTGKDDVDRKIWFTTWGKGRE
jgi:hypothetical protein